MSVLACFLAPAAPERQGTVRTVYVKQYGIFTFNVFFFAHRHVFSLPAAGRFSCSRLRGTQGTRPNTTAQVWALSEVRGTCSRGSKSQVSTGRHSEHVERSRPPYRLKRGPTTHVISRMQKFSMRHKVPGDGKVFTRHENARHATTLVQYDTIYILTSEG